MPLLRFVIILAASTMLFSACKDNSLSINVEQINSPAAHKIITPGMSSMGIIHEEKVFAYYFNESGLWLPDRDSQFHIPRGNDGLLGMGMGTIAVLDDDQLYFFNMNASLQWETKHELVMPLPENYKRLSAMKMPWQRGAVCIEDNEGSIHFYYLDEKMKWQRDETATFKLPAHIDDYLMMGSMELAIISDNKLGVYQLDLTGNWLFQEDMVLILPENTEALLSFEPGTIGVLAQGAIHFYEPDYENRYWIIDDTMTFQIPNL